MSKRRKPIASYRAPAGEPMAMLDGVECPTCWGSGYLVKLMGPPTGPDRITCDMCGGSGRDPDYHGDPVLGDRDE